MGGKPKRKLDDGGEGDLGRLKRRVYAIALSVAGFAAVVGDLLGTPLSTRPFLGACFGPVVTGTCLVMAWLLVTGRVSVRRIEAFLYLSAGTFLVFRVAALFFLSPYDASLRHLLADFSPWTAPVYVFAFLALDTRTALRAAFLLYGALLLVAAGYVLHRGPATLVPQDFNALVQEFLLSSAFLIAILYFLARTKEQLARERAQRELMATIAHTDELTGLPNRRHILNACQRELDRIARDPRAFSVVLFDIDHFKRVNDTLGHPSGDAVLRRVARVVQGATRSGDEVGRFGGEEFLVLAYGADAQTARIVAERIRGALEVDASGELPAVTASFGAAEHHEAETLAQLLARADEALYQAKKTGRNRTVVADGVAVTARG